MNPKTERKTRRGVALHDSNPFIGADLVKAKTRKISNQKGDMMVINNKTDEVVAEVAGFWHAQEVDDTKFVKLYVNGVKAFKGLTSAGTKVFEVLYLEVQKTISQDKIYMSFASVDQASNPMGLTTYKRGMSELIAKGFLAATPIQGFFWLNPDFMWNGDRLAFVKAYYKSSSPLGQKLAEARRLEGAQKKASKKEASGKKANKQPAK